MTTDSDWEKYFEQIDENSNEIHIHHVKATKTKY
jgi:hypothetical protein